MPKYRIIKWRKFSEERPVCSGEYLVMIEGAELPTLLTYEEDDCSYGWRDDEMNYYRVKWWCHMPAHPDVGQAPILCPQPKRFPMYLSEDEIITFKENLSFSIAYCDLPDVTKKCLTPLLIYLENMFVDRR